MVRQTFIPKEEEALSNAYIDRRATLNSIKNGTRWAAERQKIWDRIAEIVNTVPNPRRQDPWTGEQCEKKINDMMTLVKKVAADRIEHGPTGNPDEKPLKIGVQILLEQYEGTAVVSGIKGGESSDLQGDGKRFG